VPSVRGQLRRGFEIRSGPIQTFSQWNWRKERRKPFTRKIVPSKQKGKESQRGGGLESQWTQMSSTAGEGGICGNGGRCHITMGVKRIFLKGKRDIVIVGVFQE